ncbi:hypothetical protein BGZ81_001098 [Podila clonocystis]|nr:hypothetical protein BGZ81_001098 [Podila clonocystis]
MIQIRTHPGWSSSPAEKSCLDPASIAVSKIKAMVKGSAMGFKLYVSSSTPKIRKFQVKFRTTEDSARCASLLRQFIQCRNVLSTEGSDGPVVVAKVRI